MISTQKKIVKHNNLEFAVLYDEQTIRKTVMQMAQKISLHYKELLKNQENGSVLVVCILKGAFMFFTDLIRFFDFRIQEDFMRLSSYHGGLESTNQIKFLTQVDNAKFKGRHILIVEDIIDTGKTLFQLQKRILTAEPKSVQIAVLVRRPDKVQQIQCKWVGLNCSDFIIGYGLDLDQEFRCLPEIYQKI